MTSHLHHLAADTLGERSCLRRTAGKILLVLASLPGMPAAAAEPDTYAREAFAARHLVTRVPFAQLAASRDEADRANLARSEFLSRMSHELRALLTALAPSLGLELARTHRPTLILLDINLPEIDSYAVMLCLRENEAMRAIPVLAISANAMPRDIERGKAAGFAGYVTKPIDMVRLLGLVDELPAAGRS